jgi:hypothetical protein
VPSELDPENEAGLKLEAVRGALEIEHLHFTCPPAPRTKWTRRVPHPVLIGHAALLTPYLHFACAPVRGSRGPGRSSRASLRAANPTVGHAPAKPTGDSLGDG